MNNSLDFVKFLLDLKASPNLVCKNNNTPMHTAFKYQNFDITMALIDAGANLNVINNAN